jgi:recombination protein RecA
MFGNPETTTGGNALKFYASVRIDIRKKEAIKNGDQILGNTVKVKIVKNKVAPPFRKCEFDIMFGKGISTSGDILDLAANIDVVNKSGAWYAYNGEKIGQGRENAKNYLKEHPDICNAIENAVRAHYDLPTDGTSVDADSSQEDVKKATKKKD